MDDQLSSSATKPLLDACRKN